MDLFWKATAAVLIALILMLVLGKQEKDLSILLAIAVCCITGATAMKILTPVLDFLYALQTLAGVEEGLVGIGLAAEIVGMICADAGYASLGKNIQILASSLILYLSIPILEGMIELIREILGGL